MSEKTVTERDAVLRERAAYVRGIECVLEWGNPKGEESAIAARAFPLPKIQRPRVVLDEYKRAWKLDIGAMGHGPLELFYMDLGTDKWFNAGGTKWLMSTSFIRVWADLLANPTELVDDDGSAGDETERGNG